MQVFISDPDPNQADSLLAACEALGHPSRKIDPHQLLEEVTSFQEDLTVISSIYCDPHPITTLRLLRLQERPAHVSFLISYPQPIAADLAPYWEEPDGWIPLPMEESHLRFLMALSRRLCSIHQELLKRSRRTPYCYSCKKVHDAEEWVAPSTFFRNHTELFSNTRCPDCARSENRPITDTGIIRVLSQTEQNP